MTADKPSARSLRFRGLRERNAVGVEEGAAVGSNIDVPMDEGSGQETGTSGGLDDVNMETPLEEEPIDIDSDGMRTTRPTGRLRKRLGN